MDLLVRLAAAMKGEMSAEVILAVGQVLTVLLAGLAILVTLWGIRDQLWVVIFTEYTRRHAEIVKELPTESRRPGGKFDLRKLIGRDRDRVENAMRAYLNLCWEEFYLKQKGRIDKETWEIWKLGIRDTMRLPWFRSMWAEMRIEYGDFGDFTSFMDECLDDPRKIATSEVPPVS